MITRHFVVTNVSNMDMIFYNTGFTPENQCAIHTTFSSNDAWQYDWSDLCYQFTTTGELETAVDIWISGPSKIDQKRIL